jgi:nucleotide-binding universal stress UspA family protein
MKILLAVDGSKHTKKMLAYLTTHDELFGPQNEFTALAVSVPLPPRARAAVGKQIAETYQAAEAENVLESVLKFLKRHGIEAKRASKSGHPGEQIAKMADSGKFDLVIMGSHGHGAFGSLLMGSVSTHVLAHSKAPVLLVR